jgi:phosphoribosyl 1,2-cyclic phosphodiesterase
MKVTFYGTRGSIPVCTPEHQEFGGNTTCILVEGPENLGILDAGTGIRVLGKQWAADERLGLDKPVMIAFSHFHWDHIQGLPYFTPAYDKNRHFLISAPGRGRYGTDLKSIFETQMRRDYFPVPLDQMGATIEFHLAEDEFLKLAGATVTTNKHNHPGDAYSYRIQDRDGKVLVYCTDIEHGEELDPKVIELARGADLLIHEGHYTPEELTRHRGWGHSSWVQAVEVAEQAGVKRLMVTHHDPDHDDSFLKDIEKQVKARFPNGALAREGMVVEV